MADLLCVRLRLSTSWTCCKAQFKDGETRDGGGGGRCVEKEMRKAEEESGLGLVSDFCGMWIKNACLDLINIPSQLAREPHKQAKDHQ